MSTEDKELKAITSIMEALTGLDQSAQERSINYVLERLSLAKQPQAKPANISVLPPEKEQGSTFNVSDDILQDRQVDIKTLKDEKQPNSANQMAVLVAYYLQEVAPQPDRKEFIDSEDVNKYFKQAQYNPLPKKAILTLNNAKNAGYLDTTGENGKFRLNPVGYNLVAYNMPQESGVRKNKSTKTKKSKKKKTTKKTTSKTKKK